MSKSHTSECHREYVIERCRKYKQELSSDYRRRAGGAAGVKNCHMKRTQTPYCEHCGATENLEVHHIIPVWDGGTSEISNLRTLCIDCHTLDHPQRRKRRRKK